MVTKYYTETLKQGSQGDSVKEWQNFLKSQGYNIGVDGIFGDKTYRATKLWQRDNKLDADGIVGENTWSKAGYSNVSTPVSAPESKPFEYEDFSYGEYKESDTVKQAEAALNAQLSQKPGDYQSKWQGQLDSITDKIMNREDFSYDFNADALYQQYKDKYIQQGKLAMADTMGQAAAMTGGYGNSYAQSVGQQAYQAQLDNLNDIVPELYQMALDKYYREGDELYNQYALIGDREEQDYGRYRDSLSDWQTERDYLAGRYDSERDYDYGKYVDERDFAYGTYADDKSYAYQTHRDEILDTQWQAEWDEAARQYANEEAWRQKEWDEDQRRYEESKVSLGSGNPTSTPEPDPKPDPEPDYTDFDAGDWEAYFAYIRQSEGKAAAEQELNRMASAGLVPKNMVTYAAIGARGSSRGH